MMSRQRILESIYRAVELMNRSLPDTERLGMSEETVLYGPGTKLDSLGLVTLIVNTEQQVADDFGTTVTLASEKALSQRNSPFRTIGSLASYISVLLEGQRNA